MGNNYIRERPLQEIIDKLMVPQEDEEELAEDPDETLLEPKLSPTPDPKSSALGQKKTSAAGVQSSVEKSRETAVDKSKEIPVDKSKDSSPAAPDGDEEEVKHEEESKFLANDYLIKAEMSPP